MSRALSTLRFRGCGSVGWPACSELIYMCFLWFSFFCRREAPPGAGDEPWPPMAGLEPRARYLLGLPSTGCLGVSRTQRFITCARKLRVQIAWCCVVFVLGLATRAVWSLVETSVFPWASLFLVLQPPFLHLGPQRARPGNPLEFDNLGADILGFVSKCRVCAAPLGCSHSRSIKLPFPMAEF